jgi:hypothetical protein
VLLLVATAGAIGWSLISFVFLATG